MNLNSVLIGSEDPKRLTEYYTKVFGKPDMEDSGFAGWKIGDGLDHGRATQLSGVASPEAIRHLKRGHARGKIAITV